MFDRHAINAHNAYIDLRQSLIDEAVSGMRGTPHRNERNGRVYWYDKFRIGSSVQMSYIGEDSEDLRNRFGRIAELKAAAGDRKALRTKLVRILRAEGFMSVDNATGSLLSAFEKAGVFRLGGTVVGTSAFRLYEGELGIRLRFADLSQTQDLDIASFERLSLAIQDVVEPPVKSVLSGFRFEPVPSLDRGKVWRWKQSRGNALVEFLTPSFEEEERIRPLAALGVEAQSLHFLNYLLAEPIRAAIPYRSGVLVQIPRPERFAIHKLIVSERRTTDRLKALKDRRQAALLIEVLSEDRPEDLAEAYQDAVDAGPKWRALIEAALARMPDSAATIKRL